MFIRTKSPHGRHVLAHGATHGTLDYDRLIALSSRLENGQDSSAPNVDGLEPAWLLELSRLVALQDGADGLTSAEALFELCRVTHGLSVFGRDARALYGQVLLKRGRLKRLRQTIRHLDLPWTYHWSLRVDLHNPFSRSADAYERWLALLNEIFLAGGLEPVSLEGDAVSPFDRLMASASSTGVDDAMVTVIMPTFMPDHSLSTAVRSITSQSWRNLELLIIDDASPSEYRDLLRDVEATDDRIQLLSVPVNGGTYNARNLGLEHARGEYVTFQDADDWSHPRRLERQIEVLQSTGALATRSWAVRAFPDLSFTYVGYPVNRPNASSLLFRRKPVVELLGGFDPVRKSADMEFASRLEAAAPGSLHNLAMSRPLAITQLRPASLSRADATPGWHRWDRLAYRDAYTLWHSQIRSGLTAPAIDADAATRPFPMPDCSWASTPTTAPTRHYDVLVYNDWRSGKGAQRDAIDEIHEMTEAGLRVAVAHAETADPPSPRRREPKAIAIQELINTQAVDFVHIEQSVDVDLLLVRDPATLQFPPGAEAGLQARHVVILCDQIEGAEQRGPIYSLVDCASHAENLFSRRPRWVPRNAQARAFLSAYVDREDVADVDLPVPFKPDRFRSGRHRPSSLKPIVGRHVADHWSQWPAIDIDLLGAYPDDDRIDVRIMGGTDTALGVLETVMTPPNWVSFAPGQLPARVFLAQLDFFVYFNHPQFRSAVSREVLEALASGCVVVLPPDFERLYGDAAVYCQPSDVHDVVLELFSAPTLYAKQQQRGRAYVEKENSSNAFNDRLMSLVV